MTSAAASNTRSAQAENVPDLGYAPASDVFQLPEGLNFGPCSGVAVNSRGHIFVFHRADHALLEFDARGGYVRTHGRGVFSRPHGLRIDTDDNIWTTDIGSHIVVKMNPRGRILMVLGVKDLGAEWHQAKHLRAFNEPNDIAFARSGEIYVSQGHGKGESRVLKFAANGDFIKTWGGEGAAPGQFNVPHSIVVNAEGLLYVADRSNQRIQVFDADGKFMRESSHPGTPCGLCMCQDRRHLLLAHGHMGRIMKLDANGQVLGATGAQGKAPNQYGEAHFLDVSKDESEIFVADTLNWRVQRLVRI
jgi:DNA-binding beta-propeller fold protein YncE